MISVITKKTLIVGFQFNKYGCCKPTPLLKQLHHGYIFFLVDFLRTGRHKEQLLLNSSDHTK